MSIQFDAAGCQKQVVMTACKGQMLTKGSISYIGGEFEAPCCACAWLQQLFSSEQQALSVVDRQSQRVALLFSFFIQTDAPVLS